QEPLTLMVDKNAEFSLKYKSFVIGNLTMKNEKWTFKYSAEFKEQNILYPIVDFPDKNKEYNSIELWPFFALRIPGLGQPSVIEAIEKEKIDKNDIVELLRT